MDDQLDLYVKETTFVYIIYEHTPDYHDFYDLLGVFLTEEAAVKVFDNLPEGPDYHDGLYAVLKVPVGVMYEDFSDLADSVDCVVWKKAR